MADVRLIAAAAVLALGAPAFADRGHTPWIQPPAEWTRDDAKSSAQLTQLTGLRHFGNLDGLIDANVYLPATPGIVLYVSHVAAGATTGRDVATRAEVDELRAVVARAARSGSGVSQDAWQERVDAEHKQIEAALTWRDTTAQTIDVARLVIAGDATRLFAVTGECVARADIEAKLLDACKAALATLTPTLPSDTRVEVALAPAGSQPTTTAPTTTAPSMGPAPATGSATAMSSSLADDDTAPQLHEPPRAPVPPMIVRDERPRSDRRPLAVGAGLVIMAAVFWWNRKRRLELEKEQS